MRRVCRSVDRLAPERERVRQSGTGSDRQHHRYLFRCRLQPGPPSPVPEGQPVDLLDGRGLPPGAVAAAEPPNL